jgi:hypothetical protein
MKARFGAKSRRSGCLLKAILSRLIFFPDLAFMADMSQWQGKSQKRHNLDGFAVIVAPSSAGLPARQAFVNHKRASMGLVLHRIARSPRV